MSRPSGGRTNGRAVLKVTGRSSARPFRALATLGAGRPSGAAARFCSAGGPGLATLYRTPQAGRGTVVLGFLLVRWAMGSQHLCRCGGPANLCLLPGPSAGADSVSAGVEGRIPPEPGHVSGGIPDSSLPPLGAALATPEC